MKFYESNREWFFICFDTKDFANRKRSIQTAVTTVALAATAAVPIDTHTPNIRT